MIIISLTVFPQTPYTLTTNKTLRELDQGENHAKYHFPGLNCLKGGLGNPMDKHCSNQSSYSLHSDFVMNIALIRPLNEWNQIIIIQLQYTLLHASKQKSLNCKNPILHT